MTLESIIDYSNSQNITDNFRPFIQKYGMKDLHTSGFYPFPTEEERWTYWAKHISLNRYETPATPLYRQLYQLLQNRSYFIITTNANILYIELGVGYKTPGIIRYPFEKMLYLKETNY